MGVTSAWGKGMISIFFRQYFQKHIGSEEAWFFFPFSVYFELSFKLRLGGGKLIKKEEQCQSVIQSCIRAIPKCCFNSQRTLKLCLFWRLSCSCSFLCLAQMLWAYRPSKVLNASQNCFLNYVPLELRSGQMFHWGHLMIVHRG